MTAETIGLTAAMMEESRALLHLVDGWERAALGPLRLCRFERAGRTCLLVTSGMGIRRVPYAETVYNGASLGQRHRERRENLIKNSANSASRR